MGRYPPAWMPYARKSTRTQNVDRKDDKMKTPTRCDSGPELDQGKMELAQALKDAAIWAARWLLALWHVIAVVIVLKLIA
jgi:hypothetical protein